MSQCDGAHLREMVHEHTSWYDLYLLITLARLTFHALCLRLPTMKRMENFWTWQWWHLDEWSWLCIRWLEIFNCFTALHFWYCPLQLKQMTVSFNNKYLSVTFSHKCYSTILCGKYVLYWYWDTQIPTAFSVSVELALNLYPLKEKAISCLSV